MLICLNLIHWYYWENKGCFPSNLFIYWQGFNRDGMLCYVVLYSTMKFINGMSTQNLTVTSLKVLWWFTGYLHDHIARAVCSRRPQVALREEKIRLLPNLINSILQSNPTKHRSKRLWKEILLRESSNEPSTLFAQDHILPLPLGLGHSSSQTRTHFRLGERGTFSDSSKELTELLGYITVINPHPQVKMPFSRFFFNWRIIALQYCVGFCHITAWISHKYTESLPFVSEQEIQRWGESCLLPLPFGTFSLKDKNQDVFSVAQTQHRATCIVKDCSHLLLEWSNEQTLKLDTKISNHYQGLNFSVQESIILLNLPEWHLAIFSNSFCHLLLYLLSSISFLSEIFVLYLTEILKEI